MVTQPNIVRLVAIFLSTILLGLSPYCPLSGLVANVVITRLSAVRLEPVLLGG